ncbi:MAG TPA: hypothetical protein VHJ82_06315 [Actinomycetota bacterium]|nr:hypothetical protein [Actinomycetota bacterium]
MIESEGSPPASPSVDDAGRLMADGDLSAKPPYSEHAASFLATEHWSLLATRSMLWNEAFSRVTVFLTVLSAAIVALALVANTAGFGDAFAWFAMGLGPLVLFLGITTNMRLVDINLEEFLYVRAMNRLRHAYVDMAPEVSRYLSTGWHDDARGVFKTFVLAQTATRETPLAHFFITTPTVVSVVNAAVAAGLFGLIAHRAGAGTGGVAGVSIAVFLVVAVLLFSMQFRNLRAFGRLTPRFPSTEDDYADEIRFTPF